MAATAEVLWLAVATPQGLQRWQADEADGEVVAGRSLTLRYRTLGASIELNVVAVEPGRHLVLAAGSSRLEITVEDGGVELLHTGLGAGDETEGTHSSWQLALATLAEAVERHPGQRRFPHTVHAVVRASPELCHLYFTHPAILGRWLLVAGSLGPAGSAISGRFAWGAPFTGRVIAHCPGRDLALALDDLGVVLALRTLPSPRSADERIVLVSTSAWNTPLAADVVTNLEVAVKRLARLLEARGAA